MSLDPSSAHRAESAKSNSSSPALSSPPQSPGPVPESITVNHAGAANSLPGPSAPPVKERKKPGRKVKPKPEGGEAPDPSAAPPRKKRKPKDPNAPPAPPRQRKKKVISEETFTSDVKGVTAPLSNLPDSTSAAQQNVSSFTLPSQNGNNEAIQRPINSFFSNAPPPPLPSTMAQQPRTSGQNYDPIRSNYDPVRETLVSHNSYNNQPTTQTVNRASASPSISSLVDPPNQPLLSPSAQSFLYQQQAKLQRDDNTTPVSPSANRSVPPELNDKTGPTSASKKTDLTAPAMSKKASSGPNPVSTATSSTAASPKPHKTKEPKDLFPTPPPLPGSGLMQLNSSGPDESTEFRAPTIVLDIPLNGEPNKYINFTRLAEDAYGWDALHPRLAAQRDRLARVAAAGAALERNGTNKESGDEMSLDSEGEGEGSNIEMGGMSDGRNGNGTDGPAKKIPRKRKMKEDEYDKDDAFVDDSELLWEEQAAAANDGFFVYSGPLVPEGEKAVLDK